MLASWKAMPRSAARSSVSSSSGVDAHHHRHHAADRAGDMVAIAQQVVLGRGPPALGVEREAGEMVVDEAARDRAFGSDDAQARRTARRRSLAGQRAVGRVADEAIRARGIGRRDRVVAERLAVAEVVAGAAPAIEQPGPLAGRAGRTGGWRSGSDLRALADDPLGLRDERAAAQRREVLDHQPGGRLGAADDAGNAGAGMGAGADEIEVGDLVVAIVDPEPGALGQQRLEAEGRAEMRAELVSKSCGVKWNSVVIRSRRPGISLCSTISRMRVAIARRPRSPSRRQLAEMRHRRERVEGRMARRRHGRIGRGRMMEIERRIVGKRALA